MWEFFARSLEASTIFTFAALENVVHVAGKVDPVSDIEVINTELALADMATVEKALTRAQKASKSGNKDELAKKQVLEKIYQHLDAGEPVRMLGLSDEKKR